VDPTIFGRLFDGSGLKIRKILGELEGVSEETLGNIDHISRPSGDGPSPHDEQVTLAYSRLVMLALAESALAQQQKAAAKTTRKKAA
jgi:hypothetical protein